MQHAQAYDTLILLLTHSYESFLYPVRERKATAARAYVFLHNCFSQPIFTAKGFARRQRGRGRAAHWAHWFASSKMGKDRRKEKQIEDEALGKQADKFGKKGDGKLRPEEQIKSFSHQECRHILVEKQGEALRISEDIHNGKITFNEAAFQFSQDKAGAHGLLGWKAQHELDQDFWAAALTCKEGDWLREPVKTQWGWHLIMVQGRKTLKK